MNLGKARALDASAARIGVTYTPDSLAFANPAEQQAQPRRGHGYNPKCSHNNAGDIRRFT